MSKDTNFCFWEIELRVMDGISCHLFAQKPTEYILPLFFQPRFSKPHNSKSYSRIHWGGENSKAALRTLRNIR